jgi:Ca-activated chloride channel family protein
MLRSPLAALTFAWFAALLFLSRAVLATEGAPLERTLSPYFFVENGDPSLDALPLASTKVDVAITGVVADVTVTQRYENRGKRPIHAKYVFPASTRAAVSGMRMTIGNHVIVARIKEREQAKREFLAHKEAGKNATLLEEERPNVFTMSVANVMPGDRIDVTLRYTELLVPTDGTYEFVYPTVVGPRYSNQSAKSARARDRFVATPYLRSGEAPPSTFELEGTLSTGIPIRALSSTSHHLKDARDNPNFARFAIDDPEARGENRDFVLRYALAGDAIQSGLSLYDGGAEKFFLLMVEPPARPKLAEIPRREYVFVVDVSGSMEGFPLDTAKRLIGKMAANLRPVDRFDLVLFSGASYVLSQKSLPATPENVKAALDVLGRERGGGGTELLPALERALSLASEPGFSRTFVVVTDGYIEADTAAIDFVRGHLGEANVFSFGIGSSVNRFLIEGLAKAGQGEPFVVTDAKEADRAAGRFLDYVSAPVLTSVRVTYDGFDVQDVEPREVPDVFAARPVVVQGKWRGAPHGIVTVTGTSGSGPFTQRFDVALAAPRAENRALADLWARTRIANVSDFGFGEPSDAARAEVTALGLKYGLLTPFTSFIAVSEVVRDPTHRGTDVTEPLPLPAGVSDAAVGDSMQTAAEPPLVLLGALLLGLSALARSRRTREAWAP